MAYNFRNTIHHVLSEKGRNTGDLDDKEKEGKCVSDKTYNKTCVISTVSDQPVQLCSRARVLVKTSLEGTPTSQRRL